MRAIIAKRPGGPEVLELCEVAEPQPIENELKIKLKAFGLNKAETYNRQGNHGKFSGKWALGIEGVGEVIEDPSGTYQAGQKVATAMGGMMFESHGSYAEYVCVKRSNVVPITSELSFEMLATLPEAYLTAWGALDHNLTVKSGETLLVRGGTSSIGMAMITYAKAKGLNVIATTRKPENISRLKELGTNYALLDDGNIHEKVRELYPEGVDKAVELVGARTVLDSMKAVRRWGELAFVGFLSGPPILEKFHLMNDLPNTVKLSFFGSGALGSDDLLVENSPLNWIADQVQKKVMPSIHSKTFDISQICEAHEFLESNTALGKIVIKY